MPVVLSQITSEPSEKDVLDAFAREIGLDFACHHIGKIQSFDKLRQTAEVTINYTRTHFDTDTDGVTRATEAQYPVLLDVPVFAYGGGTAALTMPVKKGDDCLVAFNDRDIDNWFAGSSSSACDTLRLHNISDGFAFPGFRSMNAVLLNYSESRTVLRMGLLSRVAVSEAKAAMEYGPSPDDLAPGVPTASMSVNETLADIKVALGQIALQVSSGKTLISQQTAGTLGAALSELTTALSTMISAESSAMATAQSTATGMAAASTGPLAGLAAGFTALATAFGSAVSGYSSAGTSVSSAATKLGGILA